jgi:hypothetical protein
MAIRTYADDDDGVLRILLFEYIMMFIIGGIITFAHMYMHDESIICNNYYCFAHRHSWVCYAGWISLNGFMTMLIGNFVMLFTGFPILYNIKTFFYNCWCSLYNYIHKPKEERKKKPKCDLMSEFLNYKEKRL